MFSDNYISTVIPSEAEGSGRISPLRYANRIALVEMILSSVTRHISIDSIEEISPRKKITQNELLNTGARNRLILASLFPNNPCKEEGEEGCHDFYRH